MISRRRPSLLVFVLASTLTLLLTVVVGQTVAPQVADAQGSHEVVVRALSFTGTEKIVVRINGVDVKDFTVTRKGDRGWGSTNYATYSVTSAEPVEHVTVDFRNDGTYQGVDRNVRIDSVAVNGEVYEAEASRVESRGMWTNDTQCGRGFKQSEWMTCNGWVHFRIDSNPGGDDGGGGGGGGEEPQGRRPYRQGNVNWTKTFTEEFNGTSLNSEIWEVGRYPGSHGDPGWSKAVDQHEATCYHNDQVKLQDGKLHLTVRKATSSELSKCRHKDGSSGAKYVGGFINTRSHGGNPGYSVGPGTYLEAKITLPGEGTKLYNWAQFWLSDMDHVNGYWPTSGEFGILETLSGSKYKACANFHYEASDGSHNHYNRGAITCERLEAGVPHIFAMKWERNGKVTYYYNGEIVGGDDIIDTVALAGPIAYNYRQNIQFGFGVPTSGMVEPVNPQTVVVDYLDVYSID